MILPRKRQAAEKTEDEPRNFTEFHGKNRSRDTEKIGSRKDRRLDIEKKYKKIS
jgi:hypothetical protein